jgi:redox-sensitive bicupin YhaK (pirin superfamily)
MDNTGNSSIYTLIIFRAVVLLMILYFQDKMIPPRYQDTPPDKIPVVESRDKKVRVKVIAGESMGMSDM